MSEVNELPKPIKPQFPEPRGISQEGLEKLSKGDIQLSKNLQIKGEGEERKLYIRVKPDDPSYVEYQTNLKSSLKIVEGIHKKLGPSKQHFINNALDTMNQDKRDFEHLIQTRYADEFRQSKLDDLRRRSKEIPGESAESIKRKQELDSEAQELQDIIGYIRRLVERSSVKVILPEQKPDQAVAT